MTIHNIEIKHWIIENDLEYQLIDDFEYDQDYKPIIPNELFAWIDIYGQQHMIERPFDLPPLYFIDNYIINYYW